MQQKSESGMTPVPTAQSLRQRAETLLYAKKNDPAEATEELSAKESQALIHELQVHQIELQMQNQELRHSEEALRRSKERYFDLYNTAPIGYFTLSDEGLILDANLTAATMLGVTRDHLVGRPITASIFREDQDSYYLYRKKFLLPDETRSNELRMVHHNGTPFWVRLSAAAVTNVDGLPELRLVLSDITERKKLQEKLKLKDQLILAQSQQAAMGDMLSMMAHQWRQPLTVISMAINNLKITTALGEKIEQRDLDACIDLSSGIINNLSKTLHHFGNFFNARQKEEPVTLKDVLDDTLQMIGKSLEHHHITVKIENSSTGKLPIQKNQLMQVLFNIFDNAKTALVAQEIDAATITVTMNENAHEHTITICDNAGGIPESIIDTITNPYVTTKELNGKGLGLYMSKIVIEKYLHGTLSWHNAASGACFCIRFKKDPGAE